MVRLIEEAAAAAEPTARVNIFKRFDMMQRWYEVEKISRGCSISPIPTGCITATRVETLAWSIADLMLKTVGIPDV